MNESIEQLAKEAAMKILEELKAENQRLREHVDYLENFRKAASAQLLGQSKAAKEIIASWPKWKQGISISTVHALPAEPLSTTPATEKKANANP